MFLTLLNAGALKNTFINTCRSLSYRVRLSPKKKKHFPVCWLIANAEANELLKSQSSSHLLKLLINYFRLFMSLEPHHIFRMKSPALLLESFCGQILRLRTFHVIKHKEKRFRCETLKEINCIRMWKLSLKGQLKSQRNLSHEKVHN